MGFKYRFFLWCGAAGVLLLLSTTPAAAETAAPVYHDIAVPQKMTLCGEAVPLGSPPVREMLDRELTISAWEHAQVFMWLKRAGRAFPLIEKRLAKLGMPDDLKYLAVAESALRPYVHSNKAAVGTWQMIAETGVRNGLRKGKLVDERYSLESSTDAALQYLQKLHREFGSWALAMAAYNCGEARIRREIKRQNIADYYRLNLPLETERFIFRIASVKLIMENPERYGYSVPKEHIYRPVTCDTVAVKLRRPVSIAALSQRTGIDYKVLKELNPEFTGYRLPAGACSLKVPRGFGAKARKALTSLGRQKPFAKKAFKKK